MSFVSKRQKADGPEAVAAHPHFQAPWIQKLLSNPRKEWTQVVETPNWMGTVTNSMFETVLDGPDRIRAHLAFTRPSIEPDVVGGIEECWLISIGSELDGKIGRTHGGFNVAVLDQIGGSVSHHVIPVPNPPATATMTVDFKAEVPTPSVILVRAWVFEASGRKVWVKATIEDQNGKLCCTMRGLFVAPRGQKM